MLRRFILIITISLYVSASASSKPSWFGTGNVFSNTGSTDPSGNSSTGSISFAGLKAAISNVPINGNWMNTSLQTVSGNPVSIQWNLQGDGSSFTIQPNVYLVEYRSDYRFDMQPMYIYKCNYDGTGCLADYTGISSTVASSNTASSLNSYFGMSGRGIVINQGDVVNIVQSSSGNFSDSSIGTTSTGTLNLLELNTRLGITTDNAIFNMSADEYCRYTPSILNTSATFSAACSINSNGYYMYNLTGSPNIYTVVGGFSPTSSLPPSCSSTKTGYYSFLSTMLNVLVNYSSSSQIAALQLAAADNHIRNYIILGGYINDVRSSFSNSLNTIISSGTTSASYPYLYQAIYGTSSGDSALEQTAKATTLNYCLQDKGMGLEVFVGNQPIKLATDTFITLGSGNYAYTFTAPNTGLLVLKTTNKINPDSSFPFYNLDPRISAHTISTSGTSSDYTSAYLTGLNFGRYLLEVRIGRGGNALDNILGSLNYRYYVQPPGGSAPTSTTAGTSITDSSAQFTATSSGTLWIRVLSSENSLKGSAKIKSQTYTGSQVLSTGLSKHIVNPILSKYNKVMRLIYDGPTGLISNGSLINLVKAAAALYIMLFGIQFLFGQVKITAYELVARIVKIMIVINILFSKTSWEFFNTYLFDSIIRGTNFFILVFTGQNALTDSPFAFLDPIFNTYTSPSFWAAMLVQLVQFWNGLTFLAIITIMGIGIYLTCVFQVVITYVLSFITIYVLIGLAPLFIPLLLFEKTSEYFYKWISTLVKTMLVPVVFIVLLLTFNTFINQILVATVAENSWGCIKSFDIHFELDGKDLDFGRAPGFCLPFYIPKITSPYNQSSNTALQSMGNISDSDMKASGISGPYIVGSWVDKDNVVYSGSPNSTNFQASGGNITEVLSATGGASVNSAVLLGFFPVIRAAFLYFTYAIVMRQLLDTTDQILSQITGISASPASMAVKGMQSDLGKAQSKVQNSKAYKALAKASNKALASMNKQMDKVRNMRGIGSLVRGIESGYKFAAGLKKYVPSYENKGLIARSIQFGKNVKDTVQTTYGAVKFTIKAAYTAAKWVMGAVAAPGFYLHSLRTGDPMLSMNKLESMAVSWGKQKAQGVKNAIATQYERTKNDAAFKMQGVSNSIANSTPVSYMREQAAAASASMRYAVSTRATALKEGVQKAPSVVSAGVKQAAMKASALTQAGAKKAMDGLAAAPAAAERGILFLGEKTGRTEQVKRDLENIKQGATAVKSAAVGAGKMAAASVVTGAVAVGAVGAAIAAPGVMAARQFGSKGAIGKHFTAKGSVGKHFTEVGVIGKHFSEDGVIGRPFSEYGAIGKHFTSQGSIGKHFTSEGAIGGALTSEGVIGKHFTVKGIMQDAVNVNKFMDQVLAPQVAITTGMYSMALGGIASIAAGESIDKVVGDAVNKGSDLVKIYKDQVHAPVAKLEQSVKNIMHTGLMITNPLYAIGSLAFNAAKPGMQDAANSSIKLGESTLKQFTGSANVADQRLQVDGKDFLISQHGPRNSHVAVLSNMQGEHAALKLGESTVRLGNVDFTFRVTSQDNGFVAGKSLVVEVLDKKAVSEVSSGKQASSQGSGDVIDSLKNVRRGPDGDGSSGGGSLGPSGSSGANLGGNTNNSNLDTPSSSGGGGGSNPGASQRSSAPSDTTDRPQADAKPPSDNMQGEKEDSKKPPSDDQGPDAGAGAIKLSSDITPLGNVATVSDSSNSALKLDALSQSGSAVQSIATEGTGMQETSNIASSVVTAPVSDSRGDSIIDRMAASSLSVAPQVNLDDLLGGNIADLTTQMLSNTRVLAPDHSGEGTSAKSSISTSEIAAPAPAPEIAAPAPAPEVAAPAPAPEVAAPAPAPEVAAPAPAPEIAATAPASEISEPTPAPEISEPTPASEIAAPAPAPEIAAPAPASEISEPAPASEIAAPAPAPEVAAPAPAPEVAAPAPASEIAAPAPAPEIAAPTPAPEIAAPTPAPEIAAPTPAPEIAAPTPAPEISEPNILSAESNAASLSDNSPTVTAHAPDSDQGILSSIPSISESLDAPKHHIQAGDDTFVKASNISQDSFASQPRPDTQIIAPTDAGGKTEGLELQDSAPEADYTEQAQAKANRLVRRVVRRRSSNNRAAALKDAALLYVKPDSLNEPVLQEQKPVLTKDISEKLSADNTGEVSVKDRIAALEGKSDSIISLPKGGSLGRGSVTSASVDLERQDSSTEAKFKAERTELNTESRNQDKFSKEDLTKLKAEMQKAKSRRANDTEAWIKETEQALNRAKKAKEISLSAAKSKGLSGDQLKKFEESIDKSLESAKRLLDGAKLTKEQGSKSTALQRRNDASLAYDKALKLEEKLYSEVSNIISKTSVKQSIRPSSSDTNPRRSSSTAVVTTDRSVKPLQDSSASVLNARGDQEVSSPQHTTLRTGTSSSAQVSDPRDSHAYSPEGSFKSSSMPLATSDGRGIAKEDDGSQVLTTNSERVVSSHEIKVDDIQSDSTEPIGKKKLSYEEEMKKAEKERIKKARSGQKEQTSSKPLGLMGKDKDENKDSQNNNSSSSASSSSSSSSSGRSKPRDDNRKDAPTRQVTQIQSLNVEPKSHSTNNPTVKTKTSSALRNKKGDNATNET